VTGANFGFVPLYDITAAVNLDITGDCAPDMVVTINGSLIVADGNGSYILENQLPAAEYVVVVSASYDDVVVDETQTIASLSSDTTLSFSLVFDCPVVNVDCNECVDGELVANGSFEDGFNGWDNNFGHSSAGYPIDRGTFWSTDGSYGIDLIGTGPSAPGFVQQTLCTEVGKEYVLTFDAEIVGSLGALVVTVDGNSQSFSTGSHELTFTATSTSTTVRFEANAYSNYLYNNVLLDNVSIACGDGGPTDPPTGDGCETAFAFGDMTLIEVGVTNSRWGWQITAGYGFGIQPIYAGAGQNDINKGTYVGNLIYNYDGNTLNVTFEMLPGFSMDETHLYVGNSMTDVVAPGQYGNQHDLNAAANDSYSISIADDGDGIIYIVAHAVVCG